MSQLTLYYRPACPFCRKVLAFMDEKGVSVLLKDISDAANAEELVSIGGKQQVPCLIMDGKAMYESDDIIQWMGAHL